MSQLRDFFLTEYERKSSFQRMFGADHFYIRSKDQPRHWNSEFRDQLINFLEKRELISSKLQNLEEIHDIVDKSYLRVQESDTPANNRTVIQTLMFEFIESQQELYHEFMVWLYSDVIKQNFYFQKIPTIRVHLPGVTNNLVYPKWHSDSLLGHSPRDINVWFGLTNNLKSDFFVKSLDGSRQWFKEYDCDKREFIKVSESANHSFDERGFEDSQEVADIFNSIFVFDSRCLHTAVHRSEEDWTTKFSIDVRVILTSDFEWKIIDEKPVFVGDGIRKAEFRPGSDFGYHKMSIEEIINERVK